MLILQKVYLDFVFKKYCLNHYLYYVFPVSTNSTYSFCKLNYFPIPTILFTTTKKQQASCRQKLDRYFIEKNVAWLQSCCHCLVPKTILTPVTNRGRGNAFRNLKPNCQYDSRLPLCKGIFRLICNRCPQRKKVAKNECSFLKQTTEMRINFQFKMLLFHKT